MFFKLQNYSGRKYHFLCYYKSRITDYIVFYKIFNLLQESEGKRHQLWYLKLPEL